MAKKSRRAASAEPRTPEENAASKFEKALLEVLSNIPASSEEQNADPKARSQGIASTAALKAGGVSAALAIPPGPLGMLTIIPDLIVVWRMQSQMVADIAAAYGKTAHLSREQMIYCLFKHSAAQVVRDLVVRVGERLLVRRAGLRVIHRTLRRIGFVVTRRLVGRSISRWLPVLGAAAVGAYAYWDTTGVAKTAIEFFGQDLGEADDEVRKPSPKPARGKGR